MSDNAEILVDIDATASEAKLLAQRGVAHLVRRGIIQKETTDCTLGGEGHPPGPNAGQAVAGDGRPLRCGPVGDGVAVVVYDDDSPDRAYFYSGGNGVELRCDVCRKTFEPGDDYQEASHAWQAGNDDALFACPHCKSTRLLREWEGPFCEGFGRLGFEFQNWPPLKPEFVVEIAELLGHRVRLVHQHI